jgi:hypothetical protein
MPLPVRISTPGFALLMLPALRAPEAPCRIAPLHNTGEPKRDSGLKGEGFSNVKKYPVMIFRSQKVAVASPGHLKVSRELTINAVTKQVILDLEGPTDAIKDTRNHMETGASATTNLSRKEFGILCNPVLETGGVAVSDDIFIVLDIELIRNSPGPRYHYAI